MSGTDDDAEPQDPPAWQTTPPPPAAGWAPPQGPPAPSLQAAPAQPMVGGWQPAAPTPGSATAALIFGISSVVICPLVCLPAILLGRRALRRIDGADGTLGGRGQAKWGVVMGWIGVALTLVMAALVAIYFATE